MSFILSLIKALVLKYFKSEIEKAIEHSLTSWIPDFNDNRDKIYGAAITPISPKVDLRYMFPTIENQGTLNSCVGHATTSVYEAVTKKSDRSRLFVYWNARAYTGSTGMDAGCQIRNAMKAISVSGAAEETKWPYDASKVLVKPPTVAYSDGLSTKGDIVSYVRVTSLAALKTALNNKQPVVFGFSVPKSFYNITKENNILPYPDNTSSIIGGHAVVAVGYDDATKMVLVRNSFGAAWGDNGHFQMPYKWFENMTGLVADAWVLVPKV